MKGNWNRTLGFSLIEMITTLTVLAVVTAVAVPSFLSFQKVTRTESKASQLLSVLELGQSEAIKRHQNMYVYYVPATDKDDGCIGVSAKSNIDEFNCNISEGFQKFLLAHDSEVVVQAPIKTDKTKLFHFSARNRLPSGNETIKLAIGSETGKESGVMVRQYAGLKGCSNTSVTGWEVCS